jgi:hypothetical protein
LNCEEKNQKQTKKVNLKVGVIGSNIKKTPSTCRTKRGTMVIDSPTLPFINTPQFVNYFDFAYGKLETGTSKRPVDGPSVRNGESALACSIFSIPILWNTDKADSWELFFSENENR